MSYIGTAPTIGNFQVCDAISVVNGQASYTMQVGGVNATPQSANHMLVSLNGILQSPNSSFSVSGSTITFASNLVTGDVIDFIQILGDVLDLGVPSDNTVSLAKLTATGTKDATTFLRGDNTFAEAGGGIEEADFYYTNSDTSLSAATKTLISNWARNTQGVKIGTGMSVSSGIWTFPSTGIYLINVNLNHNAASNSRYVYSEIQSTTDNSTYTTLIRGYTHIYNPSSSWWAGTSISIIFDCTNTTNDKIKILSQSENATTVAGGSTDGSQAVFVKIGDT